MFSQAVLFQKRRTAINIPSLFHSSRCLHISNLWRQHQCTAVISTVEVCQDLCSFCRLVFVDKVSCFRKDLKLIFSCVDSQFYQIRQGRWTRGNAPCIWPIINSLSRRSVPASKSSLPPRASRNFRLKPTNQFSQKGFVAERLVRHTQGRDESVAVLSSYRSDGTEARAEVVLRIVRERVL